MLDKTKPISEGDKMKKLLLVILMFLVTGCTAQYNLTIDKSTLKENVKVALPKTTVTDDQLQPYLQTGNKVYPASTDSAIYKSDLTEDSDNYYLSYEYTHSYEMFNQSMFVKKCYQEVILKSNEETINLSTSDQFNCIRMEDGAYIENVDINITTKLKVQSHNADKVNGNTYTWNINESNYQSKPINLEIKQPVSIEKTIKEATNYRLVIIILIIVILLSTTFVVVNKKSKNNNNL